MKKQLRILYVENDDNDLELVRIKLLEDGYNLDLHRVETKEQMSGALKDPSWDIILSDYTLPNFSAPIALTVLQQSGLDIPFLVISGTIGEERAVGIMKAGGRDFISKNDLKRLTPVIEREIREAQMRKMKRKTEISLRGSEQRFRQIVNTAQEGIWVVDINDKTTFANRYMAKMIGLEDYEMIGKHLADFIPDLDPNSTQRGFQEKEELKLMKTDGTPVWVKVSSSPMLGDNDVYLGSLGMLTDITEAKRNEEEREKLVNELQTALKTRDEFLSIASHELKTPITSLRMQLQLMKRDLRPGNQSAFSSEKLSKFLNIADIQIERLINLIEDLLDVTRIEAGKLSFHIEEINLSDLMEEVIDRYREHFIAAKCNLSTNLQKDVLGCWDKFRIEQVIINLLTNAIKYAAGTNIEVAVSQNSESALIHIKDEGPGIPKERQGKIFERFERAIPSRNVSGLGLGLFIVKKIIEAHGGTIKLSSEVGKGSTFTIELPHNRDRQIL